MAAECVGVYVLKSSLDSKNGLENGWQTVRLASEENSRLFLREELFGRLLHLYKGSKTKVEEVFWIS